MYELVFTTRSGFLSILCYHYASDRFLQIDILQVSRKIYLEASPVLCRTVTFQLLVNPGELDLGYQLEGKYYLAFKCFQNIILVFKGDGNNMGRDGQKMRRSSDCFDFLELPLEIREVIYSLVLLPESGMLERSNKLNCRNLCRSNALLLKCCRTYSLARSVMYRDGTFKLVVDERKRTGCS